MRLVVWWDRKLKPMAKPKDLFSLISYTLRSSL